MLERVKVTSARQFVTFDAATATVSNHGPDAVFYGDRTVTASSYSGSIAAGASGTVGQGVWLVSAGKSVLDVSPISPVESTVDTGSFDDGLVAVWDTASSKLKGKHRVGWFNVRDYGATGDGATDDTAAALAAIAAAEAAGGGVVYFPAGIYALSGSLVLDETKRVDFVGDGLASELRWTTDLGAGEFGITGTFDTPTYARTIRDVYLSTAGSWPSGLYAMKGLDLRSKWRAIGVRAQFFDVGVEFRGDHQALMHAKISNCRINLRWGSRVLNGITPTYGDQKLIDCDLTGARLASIGVAPDNWIGNCGLYSVIAGFAPFAVYGEHFTSVNGSVFNTDAMTGEGFESMFVNNEFVDFALEACGNGLIFDESNLRSILQSVFEQGGASANASYTYSGDKGDLAPGLSGTWAKDYAIVCKTFKSNIVRSAIATFVPFDVGYFSLGTAMDANAFEGRIADLIASAVDGGKTFLATTQHPLNVILRNGSIVYRAARADGAITKGDLVADSTTGNRDRVKPYPTGGAAAGEVHAGFARTAAASGATVLVYEQGGGGNGLAVKNTGTAVQGTRPRLLKPDAAVAGSVLEATDWSDGPIVGKSTGAAASGSPQTVQARPLGVL